MVDIVKDIRFFRLAFTQLLTSSQIKKLREKSTFEYVNPDVEEEDTLKPMVYSKHTAGEVVVNGFIEEENDILRVDAM